MMMVVVPIAGDVLQAGDLGRQVGKVAGREEIER
jgi:photosystem II stability/assembly factor-like uncharacterized protein